MKNWVSNIALSHREDNIWRKDRYLNCMEQNKLLSNENVVVTIRCMAYNHEPYIRQCLEGFVMQKTNFRFEAIVL